MNSTHHELSFELLHVGWHLHLQNFEILLMSGNTLSWGALTQQLAIYMGGPRWRNFFAPLARTIQVFLVAAAGRDRGGFT